MNSIINLQIVAPFILLIGSAAAFVGTNAHKTSATLNMAESEEPIEAPGSYSNWYSPFRPILEAAGILKKSHEWTTGQVKEMGCPVFKCHPGVKAVIASDHASMTHILNSPPDEFDHDTTLGFGCVALNWEKMLNGAQPAIVSFRNGNNANHIRNRALIDKVIELRGIESFDAACNEVLKNGPPEIKDKNTFDLQEGILSGAITIMWKWFFNLDPPPAHMHKQWIPALFGTYGDTSIGNAVISKLKPAPSQEMLDYSADMMSRIRSSEYYPEYVKIAEELGVPESEVPGHLVFASSFNPVGPCFTIGQPGLGQLFKMPEERAKVAAELKDVQDVNELAKLPYLNAFFMESVRMFGAPAGMYRRTVKDTVVPTSEGPGVKVPAYSNIRIICSAAYADKTVFEDPDTYSLKRYIQDPSLCDKIFPYAGPSGGKTPFQCAGEPNGSATKVWLTSMSYFLRDTGGHIDGEYTLGRDISSTKTEPKDLIWKKA